MDIEENKMFDPELLPVKSNDSFTKTIQSIVDKANKLKEAQPDKDVFITVSKEFNDEFMKQLGGETYGIKLYELKGFRYSVSPFVGNDRQYVIGYFDYAQLLWQWNTFQDVLYTLDDLLTYYDWKEKSSGDWE